MGILKDFERRLEQTVEGFFARALPGGGVQPVELGKRMIRAMQDGKTIGVTGEVVAPNMFEFRLAPRDYDRIQSLGASLDQELVAVARRAAAAEGWALLGPPRMALSSDPEVRSGTFEVAASVEAGADPAAGAGAHTQLIQIAVASDAELVVLGSKRRAYPLSKDSLVIGRAKECDITLADPGASRRHAEVRREGDEWFAVDLDSTNGTLLNGKSVRRQRLRPKDVLLIGDTQIEFRA
ncbi:MAG: FhaA domain-containing protein [Actinomycetota bacterium]